MIGNGNPLQINIQYKDETIPRLQKIDKGDWIDLCAAEDVLIQPMSFKLIELGVAMKLPEGYEAHIVPRSSTFKNWHVVQTNHMGVVDNSYCGPNDWWKFPAFNLHPMDATVIHKGDRICQFRIMECQPKIFFYETTLEGKDRGGFGSTGTK